MTRTIVVGLGRSGIGAARLLKQLNRDVLILERGSDEALQRTADELGLEGIQVVLGQALKPESFETWRDGLETVVIGPGIPWDHPTLLQLRSEGIQVRGGMDSLGTHSDASLDRHHGNQRQNHGDAFAQPRA